MNNFTKGFLFVLALLFAILWSIEIAKNSQSDVYHDKYDSIVVCPVELNDTGIVVLMVPMEGKKECGDASTFKVPANHQ